MTKMERGQMKSQLALSIGTRVTVSHQQRRRGSPKYPGRVGVIVNENPVGREDGGMWYVKLEPTKRAKERVELFWASELIADVEAGSAGPNKDAVDGAEPFKHDFTEIGHFYGPIEYYKGAVLKYHGGVTPTNREHLLDKYPGGIIVDAYKGDRIHAEDHAVFIG